MHTVACLRKNPTYKKLTKADQQRAGRKIRKLLDEGYNIKQAVAIAYKMLRSKRLGPLGGYRRAKRNPDFEVIWTEDKSGKIFRANIPDIYKTVIVVRELDGGLWEWESSVTSKKNGTEIIATYSGFSSSDEAKESSVRAYDSEMKFLKSKYNSKNPVKKHRSKKNPSADETWEMLAALSVLLQHPERSENIEEHILDALEESGLWSYDSGVSEKGRKFLESSTPDI